MGLAFLRVPKPTILDWPARIYTLRGLVVSPEVPSGFGRLVGTSAAKEKNVRRPNNRQVMVVFFILKILIKEMGKNTQDDQ
jgi:hypothetical protein